MRMRSSCLAIGLFFLALPGFAQSTANIVGTVRDSSGGVVPGARVTARNVQTDYSQSRQTDSNGAYKLLLLPVGSYEMIVEREGFQKYVQTNIVLAVNDNATIDIPLSVGAVAEAVTVTAAAALVDAQSGTIKRLVDQQRIVDLPLNGRDITQLMSIQAGVIPGNALFSEGNTFVVNGSRQNGVYYMLDTGMNTDSYRNQSGVFPNPDALQEFSVQKNNFSAEYANATGAVVNAVTKSGTNQFHGSAFEFLRNGAFNARNFFAAKRDSLKRNQFGGTLVAHHEGQAVLLLRLPGHAASQRPATQSSVPAHRGHARRRLLRHESDQGSAHRQRFPGQPDSVRPPEPGHPGVSEVPARSRHSGRLAVHGLPQSSTIRSNTPARWTGRFGSTAYPADSSTPSSINPSPGT